jgi:NaMN:DMB phosphoribosyltransferase
LAAQFHRLLLAEELQLVIKQAQIETVQAEAPVAAVLRLTDPLILLQAALAQLGKEMLAVMVLLAGFIWGAAAVARVPLVVMQ